VPNARSAFSALEAAIEGRIVRAGSAEYEVVPGSAWAQFVNIRPEVVVFCATPADVSKTLRFVRRVGAEAVARGGGHCFAGRSSTGGVLIDLSPMSVVSVTDGIATVGAGALLGDIYDELDAGGLTIAAGSCPSVGIAGLTLGGGLGIIGRTYGLTSDGLVGAQVVLADGRVVDCDERRHAELFWALRGAGGGHFGVVTSFAFRTVPADALSCFKVVWRYAHAAAAIEAWQGWAPDARDELAASLLVSAPGDLQEPVVTLFGAMRGAETETASALDQLIVRVGTDPDSTFLEQMSHRAAMHFLAEHAPGAEHEDGASPAVQPRPGLMFSKSEFFRRPLPTDAIGALADGFTAGRASSQARELDFTPWGGAYNRTQPDATAFVHRSERFLLKHAVALDAHASTREQDAARGWLGKSWSLVHQWGSGGVFPNFADPGLTDWAAAYHGANYERLTRVKASYDPDNVFSFHQSLPPAKRHETTDNRLGR
jgi:FAD/FMN-containing dehydrogenase